MENFCVACGNYPGEGVYCGGTGDCWEPKKSCETCAHDLGETGYGGRYCGGRYCDNEYSGWEPKGSDIRAAQERGCVTCNKDVSSDCAECGDAYSLWEPKPSLTDTQKKISEICDEIKNMLLEKNRKYGDSAINPKRVFSKASPIEQINVRIDDKISRIMSAQDDDTEDAELDLIGYLILKRVAKKVADDVQ